MRELIVTENITVDGVIDMAKGWFDPAGPPGVDTAGPAAGNARARRRLGCPAARPADLRGLPWLLAAPDRRRLAPPPT